MHIWFLLAALLSNFLSPANQASLDVFDLGVEYEFGKAITFHAQIQNISQAKEVYVFFQPEGQDSIVQRMAFNEKGLASYTYDLQQFPIRPYANVSYWYQAVPSEGETVESWKYQFFYEDNRFIWQGLDSEGLNIRWVEGDLAFGQSILDTAKSGIQSTPQYLDGTPTNLIKVYVYPTSTDLQNAMQLSQLPWVGGQTSPDIDTILVSIPPGPESKMVMQAKIPHEMMHIIQYQAAGKSFTNLPVWLVEGMATLAEQYPNSYRQITLDDAAETGDLLPVNYLCESFPPEASSAYLAYAESASFVDYLYKNYGKSGIEDLFHKYTDGMGCEEAVQSAFGTTLERLEFNWRLESLGINAGILAMRNLIPYVLVFGLLLIPPIVISLKKTNGNKSGSPSG